MPRSARAPVSTAGTEDGQGASRPGRAGRCSTCTGARQRVVEQNAKSPVVRRDGRCNRGKRGDRGHGFFSLTSEGDARRTDFV